MKRSLVRIVKILSIIIVAAVLIAVLQEYVLCHADHNRQRLKGFYEEEKNSLDVVYLGASEVYSDISPAYAYDVAGVTGYLFATQSNSILNYKSQLKNILDRQTPQLIVIELNGAVYGDEEEDTKEANLRNYADNVPLDRIKLEWMAENVQENHIEYLFPFLKFHGVWSDFPEELKYQKTIINDQLRGYNYLKGILNETGIFQSTQRSMNEDLPDLADRRSPLTETEEKGLRDLLSYCKEQGLTNVVFARFPHIVVTKTYERFERSNTVGDIVAEYGYDYLNFERDIADTGLDEAVDFYNLDHLNVYGQRKFTAYLTEYLINHYGLSKQEKNGDIHAEWSECADYYDAYYRYSDSLIQSGDARELSEDCDLIDYLKSNYMNTAD